MHTGAGRIGLAVCVLVNVMFVSWSRRGVFGDVRAAVLEERSGGARSIVQDARAHVSWKGS